MKLIKSIPYNKIVSQSFDESIRIDQAGTYLIEINASAKSWWQNTIARRSFFLKDSLTIKLNNSGIVSLTKKKKLLADDLWNGNVLKGNNLTTYIIAYLESGLHVLSFIVHEKPFISFLKIYLLENQKIELKQLTTQKRDRIPWLTFLIDERISITSLSIIAHTEKYPSDDDDLGLKIDTKIIRNQEAHTHKEWYWCGKTLLGKTKIFKQEFEMNTSFSRIDIVADGTPTIDEFILTTKKQLKLFTNKDVKEYTYKGQKDNEDYNRFDAEILDAVNEWNNVFNDACPPTELLHPNLVKAMIYIESRMGYFESSGYPSYPDVMQVANPDNPAIHTLNRDGWTSPITKKITEEREWKDGKINYIDFDGRANGVSSRESILWGVRWLYHLAQGITDDKKRYWKTWKEAVKLYNGSGNSNYNSQVYDIYLQGIDRRKNNIKLWSIGFLFFLAFLGSGLGVYAHENNGYFWLTFDSTQEKGVEYVLTLNEGRGILIKKTPIAVRYSNGGNFYDINKKDKVNFYFKDLSNDNYPEIIIKGVDQYGETVYVLQKVRDEWIIIPNIGDYETSGSAPAFHGHDVSFINIDGKGWLEAKRSTYIGSTDARGNVWHTWYRYDQTIKAFVFIKKNIEPVLNENDPFSDLGIDRKMKKEAPYYQWY